MFLALIQDGPYIAVGSYHLGADGDAERLVGRPAQLNCRITHRDRMLRCEGSYAGAAKHPFSFAVTFDEMLVQGTFQLESPHTGAVKGFFGWSEAGYDFAGWSTDRLGAVGLHLRHIKEQVFGLTGAIARDDSPSLSFNLTLMLDDPLVTKANVVSMTRRPA